MTSRERRWDELQARWAQGEALTPQEEQERLAYAEHDAVARKELELFAQLRARAAEPADPVASSVVNCALEAVKAAPRLRLVTTMSDGEEPPSVAPIRTPRRAVRFVVPAALLAVASAFGVIAQRTLSSPPAPSASEARLVKPPSLSRAELVLAAGPVQVGGRDLNIGQRPLVEGESVATGEGRACLTIDPGIDVCLAAHTTVELTSLVASSVRLRVRQGTALAALSRRAPGSSFALATGDVCATAHGTKYLVRQEGAGSEVLVVEGAVEVTRGRERQLVDAHSRVVVPAGAGAFAKTPVGRSEEARLLALRAPHGLWTSAAVGVLNLAASPPSATQASIDDEAPLPLPLQTFAGAGTHRVQWRNDAGAETTAWVEIPAGETRRLVAPSAGSARAITSEPAEKPSATGLLEHARRELAHAKPRQALALYEQLRATHPGSTEARTVLVTMGKLELDLARPDRALSRFDAYLREGGTLVPEALAGKARALRALGRSQEERVTIQKYLAAHPHGFDAPLFAKRLQQLGEP